MTKRKPLQGTSNIIRFNWPYYVLSMVVTAAFAVLWSISVGPLAWAALIIVVLVVGLTLISLLVSFYVYDLSNLYSLNWLDGLPSENGERIVNINAGFDETSVLIAEKFDPGELLALDFYDAAKHTEPSIRRARAAYQPYPGTTNISTNKIPIDADSVDKFFAILSAHEIRDAAERRAFFAEVSRVLSRNGRAVVVERLRDAANFLAYNIGALHFHSHSSWLESFAAAGLVLESEKKITPFVTAFFLKKNGAES